MGKSILVVDDEQRICESLKRLLSKEGYSVISAQCGSSALKEMESEDVDVAIIDVKMPDMDGVALLKALKAKKPQMGVIMMTAYADVDDYLTSMNLGAFQYLTKPVNIDELKSMLSGLQDS